MVNAWLIYAASAIVIGWGVAHIVPTPAVVKGFGAISADNRRIITMEWVAEGLALSFIGLLTLIVVLVAGAADPVGLLVDRLCAAALIVFAGWTAIAGFRTPIIPIKICPLVLSTAAALLIAATFV